MNESESALVPKVVGASQGRFDLRVWGVSRARPTSHDDAVRNSRPWSSSCVAIIHDYVILLVIITVLV